MSSLIEQDTGAPDTQPEQRHFVIEHLTEFDELDQRGAIVNRVVAWKRVGEVDIPGAWARDALNEHIQQVGEENVKPGWYRALRIFPDLVVTTDEYFIEQVRSLRIERGNYYGENQNA